MRAVVADDDPLARRMIRVLLRDGGVTVVADAADGYQALAATRRHKPDVVLVDLDLPGQGVADVTRQIATDLPEVRVVVLASGRDEGAALRVLHAGASGFVSKADEIHDLPRLLGGVVRGEAAITPRLSMRIIEALRAIPADGCGLRPVRSTLTNREWEVIDHLTAGASTREVSEQLVLSIDTVYTHIKNAMRKLGVHTRAEAIEAARVHRSAGLARRPAPKLELAEAEVRLLLGGDADPAVAAA